MGVFLTRTFPPKFDLRFFISWRTMTNLPLARQRDVVVQEVDKEFLVYDLRTDMIHSLTHTSAELKRGHKFSDDLVHLALDQLREVHLIETDDRFVSTLAGMSRREAIRR